MRIARVVGPLLLLAIAGCGERPVEPGAPQEQDPLRGRTFLSTEVTEAGKPRPLVAETRVSLNFTDDGRLLATAGCNTMTGPVSTADGRIDVGGGLAMTEMGCDPPRHEQDSWLAGLLSAEPTWRLDGSRLVVSSTDAELVLEDREVADPDRPLTDITWAVDTILDGQTASSTPAAATATLTFRKDKVEIFGGCNGGSATYTASGDSIRFENAVMTLKACSPDIMRLEAAVLDVVRDEVEVEIEADRLTLTHPSGKGLQLRAK
ncbi:MAG: META domain-containing protein [Actinophytocola sp.]|uniref:META domain-containing protein n=1 Tax=Actinophytocola sp. TaxID=1872138 RepID=UPI001326DEB7|nr:META domain-containing protein [Actinophytocola sp.]MPZ79080.1 META domain-containing protein [Actinophytocola sp.]